MASSFPEIMMAWRAFKEPKATTFWFEITNAPNGKQYDRFTDGSGGGGTTTVVVDRNGTVVKDYVSLGGTIRNCAGGPTYWNSWISCEENVTTPTSDLRATRRHGYNFEVPSHLGEAVEPIPLVAMGRMNHEAVSVDARSGYIYQTEDMDTYVEAPRLRGLRSLSPTP